MGFKGLSNAVTNTHPLLPSMGTTRQKSSCRNGLQNGPRSLSWVKVGTPIGFARRIAYKRLHSETRGPLPWPQRGFALPAKSSPKEQPEEADARLMACVRFLRRRGRAGLRDLFRFCRNCGLYALRSGPFRVCEARGVSPLSACSTYRRNARCPLVNAANSPFPCLARFFFDSSSAKYCPLSLQMPKGPAGYPLGLSLLFASPYLP